jgi:hypothetical protein
VIELTGSVYVYISVNAQTRGNNLNSPGVNRRKLRMQFLLKSRYNVLLQVLVSGHTSYIKNEVTIKIKLKVICEGRSIVNTKINLWVNVGYFFTGFSGRILIRGIGCVQILIVRVHMYF